MKRPYKLGKWFRLKEQQLDDELREIEESGCFIRACDFCGRELYEADLMVYVHLPECDMVNCECDLLACDECGKEIFETNISEVTK
jgi:hypothetical protein